MKEKDIQDLLNRYQRGECTPEEEEKLKLWYNKEFAISDWMSETGEELLGQELKTRIDTRLRDIEPIRHDWLKYIAAAILLFTIGVSLYLYQAQKVIDVPSDQYALNDIDPGGNKAILTLADGTKISLTDAPQGKLATESGITITKSVDGLLVYTITAAGGVTQNNQSTNIAYNTISTPRGGQYRINLPDGTQVWLNSESSLKFPMSFTHLNEREVQLNGEAYFEVSENKNQPFRVWTGNQMVEVLGTHFNVMAYPGETEQETTLLEGKVSVAAGNQLKFITPGQQVKLKGSQMKILKDIDLGRVVAWKNNLFEFDNTEIEKVLRQIERWYDVEVEYQEVIPDVHFTGVVPRDLKVSTILRAMEETSKVKFKIEGRIIKVINKNR